MVATQVLWLGVSSLAVSGRVAEASPNYIIIILFTYIAKKNESHKRTAISVTTETTKTGEYRMGYLLTCTIYNQA